MKAKKVREMSSDELVSKVTELKGELFNLRFQQATGQLQNPIRLHQCKRDIARVKTILHERELGLKRAL